MDRMTSLSSWWTALRAPSDDGGAAGGGADSPPPAGAGAGDPPPAGGAAGDPPARPWWEGEAFREDADWIKAKGFAEDDPAKALEKLAKSYRGAEKRLGRPPEDLMDKPGKDKPVAEWLREHGAVFNVPDKPEGYEIGKPKDWPADMPWSDELADGLRATAHAHGLPKDAVGAVVELYAQHQRQAFEGVATQLAAARQEMEASLKSEWGEQYSARLAEAQQAAQAVLTRAGIGQEQALAVMELIGGKAGDAGVVKLFSVVAEALGEDGIAAGGGARAGAMTPAEARAELKSVTEQLGAAMAANDRRKAAELTQRKTQLAQIAAGGR